MGIHARRRAIAAAAAVVLVALVVALAAGSGASSSGPPDAAARLVPADALAYVHLSTDTARPGVRQAAALARRFPAFAAIRGGLLGRLVPTGCGARPADVRGREAAVAQLTTGRVVLLDAGRDGGVGRAHLCGATTVQRLGRFLAVGETAAVATVEAVRQGHQPSLADSDLYRSARSGLPGDRFADGYLSAAGVRGFLGARGDLGAMVSGLLDDPRLRAVGLAAEARAPGARLTVRSVLAEGRAPAGHTPGLLARVPAGVVVAEDTGDLAGTLQRFGTLVGGLDASEQRALARAMPGEVALWLTPLSPPHAPTLTLVAAHGVASRLPPTLGGRPLAQATIDGRLVVSTRRSGIDAARAGGPRLLATPDARAVIGDAPDQVSALGFLDFSELLRLGEQTGLDASRAYQGVSGDLRRVRAVGAVATGDAGQTTLQVELSIP